MPLPRNDHTRSTHVSTTGNHDNVSGFKLDVVDNLVVDQVELDGVVSLDDGVGVSDSSTVVGDEVRNTLLAELVGLDLQELVGSLFRGDSVDGESTLDVVQQSEVFTGSLDGDDVCKRANGKRHKVSSEERGHYSQQHRDASSQTKSLDISVPMIAWLKESQRLTHETSRVGFIGPDLSINLDNPLCHDGSDFSAGQGVLQSVSQEDGQGQAFSELVGTGGRSRGLRKKGLRRAPRRDGGVYSRKYPTTCPTSMMRELLIASSASWVLEPV